jgi:hypothetical protein
MKKLTATVIALSAAVIATSAQAQQAPVTGSQNQPRKLFFEGDIVRHALPGQQGPFCVLANQFRRKEAIAWRIRTLLPNGDVADDKVLKSLVVELGNGQKIAARFGPHGNPPTDYFWSFFWTIPDDFPTGSLGYKVHATMNNGERVTWEPFTRPATQLTVIAGEPTMAPARP